MRPLDSVVSSTLAARLLASAPEQQRTVTAGVAQAAVNATRLEDEVVDEALQALRVENISPGLRDAVAAIAETLDGARSRAAAAVAAAHHSDPVLALGESLHAAALAVDDPPLLEALLSDIITLIEPRSFWAAQAFAALHWPRFVDVDGFVLLRDRYSPENLAAWRAHEPAYSRAAIEDVINHQHLEDITEATSASAAHRIAAAWTRALHEQFPDRTFNVEIYDTDVITAFQA